MFGWLTNRHQEDRARVFSPEAMHRAWRAVRTNGPTPGVDGVTLRRFGRDLDENLASLRASLVDGSYEPLPVKRIFVPKSGGGMRPLAIWAVRDRVAQRVVHEVLTARLDPQFLPCSYGFRPGRSVADAVAAVIEARDRNRRWVVDADIKNCFGSIDTRRLMAQVRRYVGDGNLVKLIAKWLRTQVQNPARSGKVAAGASQGGVITPLLANLYLHPFDLEVKRRVAACTLVRFADDFVILCRKRREAQAALGTATRALRTMRLQLNPHKTQLLHFDEGFKFLGVFFLRNEHFDLS